jgi:hypothetical protein
VLPLVIGLALAPLLGGRLSKLGELRFRWVARFYVAIALQIVAFPISQLPWRTPDRVAVVLWLVSYALFAAGAAVNLSVPGIPLIAVGMFSNVAAIVSNRGAHARLAIRAPRSRPSFAQSRNSERLSAPHLPWLVDRWARRNGCRSRTSSRPATC